MNRAAYSIVIIFSALMMGPGCGKTQVEISISVPGDVMKYDVTELRVPRDSYIKLTLINKSTLPTMRHNIIIYDLQGKNRGIELDMLGDMAAKVGEGGGYLPPVPGIIAASKLADPGQSVTIEFDAPPPGEYLFVCTFQPAHYKTMNGKFIVE